ncbi:hypothetical protein [Edwardsiella tarda]|uniref:hypothetical protein n=1 Tax=Edwardsiella tarda TaxID=636 RepID=UPI00351C28C0
MLKKFPLAITASRDYLVYALLVEPPERENSKIKGEQQKRLHCVTEPFNGLNQDQMQEIFRISKIFQQENRERELEKRIKVKFIENLVIMVTLKVS